MYASMVYNIAWAGSRCFPQQKSSPLSSRGLAYPLSQQARHDAERAALGSVGLWAVAGENGGWGIGCQNATVKKSESIEWRPNDDRYMQVYVP